MSSSEAEAAAVIQEPAMSRAKWFVLVAMVFGLFMPMLDNLVVNVALPTIQRDLNTGVSELQWIIDAYTLTFASFMLTGGTLADLYGRKRFFIGGLTVFTLGSLLCGLAGNIHELIAFRALQGLGGTLILPGSLSIITATFHGRERGAAIGIWAAMSGVAVAIGPLIGGYLVQHANWQSIFYINVPIGVVAVLLTTFVVPESRDTSGLRKLDPPGVLTGTVGLFFLVYATIEGNSRGWTDGLILGSFALAGVFLAAFLWVESHRESPMLPLSFFRSSTFSSAMVVAASVFLALFGVTFFFSLYLQNVEGYSPVATGIRLFPFTAMILFIAPVAGRLSDRFGSRWFMTCGTLALALGLLMMLRIEVDSSYPAVILPAMMVMGGGMALTMSPMTAAVMGSVEQRQAGIASATQTTSQQVGGVFGIALLGAIVTASFKHDFLANLVSAGLPSQAASKIAASVGSSAAAGAVSSHDSLSGVPPQMAAKIPDAVHASFVHGLHVGIFVAIGFVLGASLLSAVFVRSHVQERDTSEGTVRAQAT